MKAASVVILRGEVKDMILWLGGDAWTLFLAKYLWLIDLGLFMSPNFW